MSEESAFRPLGDTSDPGPGRGVGVFILDRQGRCLLHLRDDVPDIPWAGMWSVFGGGVEAGEGLAEAACREIAEETGVDLALEDIAPFGWLCSTSPRRPRFYPFESARPVEPGEIRLGEGAGFGFFTEAQALALNFVPFMRPALLLLLEERRKAVIRA
ncbi:MAG: NUDIX domain-containing protein [Pseudomonadota bacterium]